MTAPVIQPPLGVASKTLPSLSTMAMCVVSLLMPAESSPNDAWISAAVGFTRALVDAVSAMFARQYDHVFTLSSYFIGSPATSARDARERLIKLARSRAYSFDRSPWAGAVTKAGSA